MSLYTIHRHYMKNYSGSMYPHNYVVSDWKLDPEKLDDKIWSKELIEKLQ